VVAAYQPKGAVDLAASYVNLANPGTLDAVPQGSVSLGTNGWEVIYTSSLETNIPATAITTCILRYQDRFAIASSYSVFGSLASGKRFFAISRSASDVRSYGYGTTNDDGGATASAGIIAISGGKGYFNGVLETNPSTEFSSGNGNNIILNGYNNNGTYTGRDSQTIVCASLYKNTLTPAQVAALSAAMAAL
jgi:hypothetical protein